MHKPEEQNPYLPLSPPSASLTRNCCTRAWVVHTRLARSTPSSSRGPSAATHTQSHHASSNTLQSILRHLPFPSHAMQESGTHMLRPPMRPPSALCNPPTKPTANTNMRCACPMRDGRLHGTGFLRDLCPYAALSICSHVHLPKYMCMCRHSHLPCPCALWGKDPPCIDPPSWILPKEGWRTRCQSR